MTTSPLTAALITLFALLVLRAFCEAALGCMLSRNARRAYRETVSLWQRWLMLRAHEFVKDRYSKTEKRTMPNKALARLYCAVIIPMHVLLAASWIIFALQAAGVLGSDWARLALTGYCLLWGACMLLISMVDEIVHRQFWRRKRGL